MDKILKIRSEINKSNEDIKISVNDFVIKATALALRDVPEANSQWLGDKIRLFKNADISVAVSTDGGLITPIVFEANKKGLKEISANVKELAKKARSNKL
jgi:pyruvate dehydrogenase E2 component (dihydrolipoamide acetyltransferase)